MSPARCSAITTTACDAPSGYVDNYDDCDDDDSGVSPSASEVCGDGIDNDCDGYVDESYEETMGDTTYFVKPVVAQLKGYLTRAY